MEAYEQDLKESREAWKKMAIETMEENLKLRRGIIEAINAGCRRLSPDQYEAICEPLEKALGKTAAELKPRQKTS